MIVIIMIMILYDIILKTLKNPAFAHAAAYYPPGTLNIFWFLDRVLGLRSLKMAPRCPQDGPRWPKMATRWPKMVPSWPHGAPTWVIRRSWKWLSLDDVVQK